MNTPPTKGTATPRPWTCWKPENVRGGKWYIGSTHSWSRLMFAKVNEDDRSMGCAEADAKLIVEAVNNHDRLTEENGHLRSLLVDFLGFVRRKKSIPRMQERIEAVLDEERQEIGSLSKGPTQEDGSIRRSTASAQAGVGLGKAPKPPIPDAGCVAGAEPSEAEAQTGPGSDGARGLEHQEP